MRVIVTKEDIAYFRGEEPTQCDFCGESRSFDQLEPEEAGQWVCHACMQRWLLEDYARVNARLCELYTPLDRAKWWFTKQPALRDHEPHWVVASG
ncbi:MAG TPA: hypothetical protein VFT26_12200, partial [Pyrinomonadaceae bacterium]|nr:hypothetical protein [Pyrinomonadaceae bacterium]